MGEDHSFSIVTAVCSHCGKMQIEDKYYEEEGNAATKFIVCDKCLAKQKKKNKKK